MTPFQLLVFSTFTKTGRRHEAWEFCISSTRWNVFTCLDSVQHVRIFSSHCSSELFTSFRKNITFVNTPIYLLQQAVQCLCLFPESSGPVHFSWSVARAVKILFSLLWIHWREYRTVVLPCHYFEFLWHRTWDYWNQWACRNLLNWNVYLVVPMKERKKLLDSICYLIYQLLLHFQTNKI